MARLVVTILGCGASPGVPRIGGDWGACDPNEPKNRRSRCSILIERFDWAKRPTRILVDTPPDMRAQLLTAEVDHIDCVLYTHHHADHTHGIDDLRAFFLNTKRLVDIYADAPTYERLFEAFAYCFRTAPGSFYPPILRRHAISVDVPVTISGAGGPIEILPFRQIHGDMDALGFRVGGFAYSCDISDLPAESFPALAGLDLWVLNALRYQPHPSHLTVGQSLAWIDRIAPKAAVLTHLHGDLDYATLKRKLPVHVEPAYDGMRLEFEMA